MSDEREPITRMDFSAAVNKRERHDRERSRWLRRLLRRPVRCRECGLRWPCPAHRHALTAIREICGEVLAAAREAAR